MKIIYEHIGDHDCGNCGWNIEDLEISSGEFPETWNVRLSLGCFDGIKYNNISTTDLHDTLEQMASTWYELPEVVDAITAARTRFTLQKWDDDESN